MELKSAHLKVIQRSKIFQNITEESLHQFLDGAYIKTYARDENIITEGDTTRSFFIVLEGRVGIYKRDEVTDDDYLFTTLDVGDEFGELSLMIRQERSATVRAQEDVVALELASHLFDAQDTLQSMATYSTLLKNIAHELARKLVLTDDFTLQSIRSELKLARTQSAMAEFIIFIIGIMTLFAFSTAIVSSAAVSTAVVDTFSNVATGASVVAFLIFIYRSSFSFEEFGLTRPEKPVSLIISSLGWSIGLILLTIAGKLVLIETVPVFSDFPLFFVPGQDYSDAGYTVSTLTVSLAVGYVVLALVQEIMARGVMQGVLTEFFNDWQYQHTLAILLSNGLFAASHLHISPGFAVITFFTGCLWGVQYISQKSIIGVWISHTLVGLFALRLLGLVPMIRLIEG